MENKTKKVEVKSEPLLIVIPNAIMFGFIECALDSLKILKDGSLVLNHFCCALSQPKMYYNLIIPPTDLFDWMSCKSLNFPTIIFRLKKDAVERVKENLNLRDGFSCIPDIGSRYIIVVLNTSIEEQTYKVFLDILDGNDVRLGLIGEFEARYRYECAQQNTDFETNVRPISKYHSNNACEAFSVRKILDTKYRNISDSEPQEEDLKTAQLFGELSAFATEPKVVMFGTYECKLERMEILVFESLKFESVPKNEGNARMEGMEVETDVSIPFSEVKCFHFCADKQIPAIFLELRPNSTNLIQKNLCINQDSVNGFMFNINSDLESERFLKVVFNDYFAFQLIVNSFYMASQVFKFLQIEEIESSKAWQLLDTSNIVLLRKELSKCNAMIALMGPKHSDNTIQDE